jgi:ubiquinone/menaquinone biosynthesis C-methylase UbiE
MTNKASEFIGNIPENYDNGLGPRIFFDYAEDLSRRVAAYGPESVLELAAGTGIVSRRLRNALPEDCKLISTDLNAPMLEIAQNKFQPGEAVSFEAMDATNLEYENEEFDAVACQFGVMFFPDKERSYSEVYRVLKPGGHYIFNVWGTWENNKFARIIHDAVASFFPDSPPGFYKVPFGYNNVNEIRAAVSDAGFESVEIESLNIVSSIPSAEEFAQGAVFGNPVFDEIVSRGGNPEEVRGAVTKAIENHLGNSMELQAIIIEAEKR